jgi:hypothetical protein
MATSLATMTPEQEAHANKELAKFLGVGLVCLFVLMLVTAPCFMREPRRGAR